MNRTAYKNQHCREHYDRIYLTIPKGEKERIKAAASALGMSVATAIARGKIVVSKQMNDRNNTGREGIAYVYVWIF